MQKHYTSLWNHTLGTGMVHLALHFNHIDGDPHVARMTCPQASDLESMIWHDLMKKRANNLKRYLCHQFASMRHGIKGHLLSGQHLSHFETTLVARYLLFQPWKHLQGPAACHAAAAAAAPPCSTSINPSQSSSSPPPSLQDLQRNQIRRLPLNVPQSRTRYIANTAL